MADRAEDLIGQYLSDLLAPAAQAGQAVEQTLNPAVVELGGAPKPCLPAAEPLPVFRPEPIATQAKPPPAPLGPSNGAGLTPVQRHLQQNQSPQATLAEPARAQLQQLLNSAWQAPAPALVSPHPIAPAPVNASVPATAPLASQVKSSSQVELTSQLLAPSQAISPPPPIPHTAQPAAILPSGRPAWATKTFDSLLVDVAGLKLAIPLVVLGHIFQVQEGFAHLPGQGPLFLGALTTPRGSLRVINTALLVMPERYDPAFTHQVQFVVSLAIESGQGQPWQLALAVNRVAQPVSIASEDVVWRGERSKRPWLLGTVKSQMCALLDVSVLGEILAGAASA